MQNHVLGFRNKNQPQVLVKRSGEYVWENISDSADIGQTISFLKSIRDVVIGKLPFMRNHGTAKREGVAIEYGEAVNAEIGLKKVGDTFNIENVNPIFVPESRNNDDNDFLLEVDSTENVEENDIWKNHVSHRNKKISQKTDPYFENSDCTSTYLPEKSDIHITHELPTDSFKSCELNKLTMTKQTCQIKKDTSPSNEQPQTSDKLDFNRLNDPNDAKLETSTASQNNTPEKKYELTSISPIKVGLNYKSNREDFLSTSIVNISISNQSHISESDIKTEDKHFNPDLDTINNRLIRSEHNPLLHTNDKQGNTNPNIQMKHTEFIAKNKCETNLAIKKHTIVSNHHSRKMNADAQKNSPNTPEESDIHNFTSLLHQNIKLQEKNISKDESEYHSTQSNTRTDQKVLESHEKCLKKNDKSGVSNQVSKLPNSSKASSAVQRSNRYKEKSILDPESSVISTQSDDLEHFIHNIIDQDQKSINKQKNETKCQPKLNSHQKSFINYQSAINQNFSKNENQRLRPEVPSNTNSTIILNQDGINILHNLNNSSLSSKEYEKKNSNPILNSSESLRINVVVEKNDENLKKSMVLTHPTLEIEKSVLRLYKIPAYSQSSLIFSKRETPLFNSSKNKEKATCGHSNQSTIVFKNKKRKLTFYFDEFVRAEKAYLAFMNKPKRSILGINLKKLTEEHHIHRVSTIFGLNSHSKKISGFMEANRLASLNSRSNIVNNQNSSFYMKTEGFSEVEDVFMQKVPRSPIEGPLLNQFNQPIQEITSSSSFEKSENCYKQQIHQNSHIQEKSCNDEKNMCEKLQRKISNNYKKCDQKNIDSYLNEFFSSKSSTSQNLQISKENKDKSRYFCEKQEIIPGESSTPITTIRPNLKIQEKSSDNIFELSEDCSAQKFSSKKKLVTKNQKSKQKIIKKEIGPDCLDSQWDKSVDEYYMSLEEIEKYEKMFLKK